MPSCIINSCISMTRQKKKKDEEHVILHCFPKDIRKIRVWLVQTKQKFNNLEALAQKILEGNRNYKYRLCSKHFASDCYVNFGGIKKLKEEALPSIFPTIEDGKLLIDEMLKRKKPTRKRFLDTELKVNQPSLEDASQSQLEPSFPAKCSVATQTDADLTDSDVIMKLPIPLLKVEEDNELMQQEPVKYDCTMPQENENLYSNRQVSKQVNESDSPQKKRLNVHLTNMKVEEDNELVQQEPGKYDCTMPQENENLCSTRQVSKAWKKTETTRAARILNLTLEMSCLITGEDYTVVKKSLGWLSRTESEFTETPLPSLIHEEKILELNNEINELLTGEVPVRCEDVTVYFSTEEWEYFEEHKDKYKDVKIKDRRPLTSPEKRRPWLSEENKRGESNAKNPLETCPSPVYCPEHPENIQSVPLDDQDSPPVVITVTTGSDSSILLGSNYSILACHTEEHSDAVELKLQLQSLFEEDQSIPQYRIQQSLPVSSSGYFKSNEPFRESTTNGSR